MPNETFITTETIESTVRRCEEAGMDMTSAFFALTTLMSSAQVNAEGWAFEHAWMQANKHTFGMWNDHIENKDNSVENERTKVAASRKRSIANIFSSKKEAKTCN